MLVQKYSEREHDKTIEMWRYCDTEIWVGFSLDEIISEIQEITGFTSAEVFKDMEKLSREDWDREMVVDTETHFQPRYTLSNQLARDMMNGVHIPYCLSTTEF